MNFNREQLDWTKEELEFLGDFTNKELTVGFQDGILKFGLLENIYVYTEIKGVMVSLFRLKMNWDEKGLKEYELKKQILLGKRAEKELTQIDQNNNDINKKI